MIEDWNIASIHVPHFTSSRCHQFWKGHQYYEKQSSPKCHHHCEGRIIRLSSLTLFPIDKRIFLEKLTYFSSFAFPKGFFFFGMKNLERWLLPRWKEFQVISIEYIIFTVDVNTFFNSSFEYFPKLTKIWEENVFFLSCISPVSSHINFYFILQNLVYRWTVYDLLYWNCIADLQITIFHFAVVLTCFFPMMSSKVSLSSKVCL